jgi:hypothetical protein
MDEVYDRLFVGDTTDCRQGDDGWSVVHACKDPCHRDAVGYRSRAPDTSHPHYLSKKDEDDLYLNMIDPERPLFQKEMFGDFFAFAVPRWAEGDDRLLIHCNQGLSRSPSLALLLLAACTDAVDGSSFVNARDEFEGFYPRYQPSRGIETYLSNNWDALSSSP